MTEERIDELIRKGILTVAERAEVREAADEAGIKYEVKKGCRTCYEQILAKLYEVTVRDMATSVDGWRLKKAGMSFRVGGVLVSNSTIAGMEVGKLHPVVRDAYFVKVKDEEASDGQDSKL